MKLNKYDVIEITWLDSHSKGGWATPSEIKKWIDTAEHNFQIKTVGYYFQRDNDFVRICQSYDHQHKDPEGQGDDNKDHLFAVAKSCIKEIKIIKRSKQCQKDLIIASKMAAV